MSTASFTSHADFLRLVRERFPSLAASLEDQVSAGLLHVQMGEFAKFAEDAIERGDWERFRQCTSVIDALMERPDPELENALNVSYFEMLTFDGENGPKAWAMLPPHQQAAWKEMQSFLLDQSRKFRALKLNG